MSEFYSISLNPYRGWLQQPPASRQDYLRGAAKSVLHRQVPDTAEEARSNLLPLIRNAADRGTVIILDEKSGSGLVYRPLCDSLEIELGYDRPGNVLSVSINQLSNWNLSEQEGFDIALDNLRARSAKPMKQMAPGAYESAWDDSHGPARLLLPDVLQRHATRGAPVVMAPGRGKLLLTGDQDQAGIGLIVRRAEQELSQPRPLSPLMLRLVEGHWTIFEPEAHAAKLHNLRLVAEAQAYAYQKQFLDERSARAQIPRSTPTAQRNTGALPAGHHDIQKIPHLCRQPRRVRRFPVWRLGKQINDCHTDVEQREKAALSTVVEGVENGLCPRDHGFRASQPTPHSHSGRFATGHLTDR